MTKPEIETLRRAAASLSNSADGLKNAAKELERLGRDTFGLSDLAEELDAKCRPMWAEAFKAERDQAQRQEELKELAMF